MLRSLVSQRAKHPTNAPLTDRQKAPTASWLCYYRALQEGPASLVVSIDKLSILVTVAFSALMLRERVSGRYLLGIAGMCTGAVLMVIG